MFKEYFKQGDIHALVLASKNGIPIATCIKKKDRSESFSALSATVLGASEVILSGLGKNRPELIEIDAGDSVLLIKELDRNSVLSLLGDSREVNYLKEILYEIDSKINNIKKIESTRGV